MTRNEAFICSASENSSYNLTPEVSFIGYNIQFTTDCKINGFYTSVGFGDTHYRAYINGNLVGTGNKSRETELEKFYNPFDVPVDVRAGQSVIIKIMNNNLRLKPLDNINSVRSRFFTVTASNEFKPGVDTSSGMNVRMSISVFGFNGLNLDFGNKLYKSDGSNPSMLHIVALLSNGRKGDLVPCYKNKIPNNTLFAKGYFNVTSNSAIYGQ